MSKSFLTIGLFILIFISHDCSLFEPEYEYIGDIDKEINEILSREKIPSLAACIIHDTGIVWQNYYGYRDFANQKAVNSETIYEVASVSKLAIVTAIMQLSERGLLDINSDINNYLPFPVKNPHYPETIITTYILLTHTSGLAWPVDEDEVLGFYDDFPLDSAPPMRDWIPKYILTNGTWYSSKVWKNTVPGKRELYSNIGAAILAYLVEVVSGMDFNSYCKQNIFQPLEMINTSYAYSDLNMEKIAKIYSENYQTIGFRRQLAFPTHALKTTVRDFSHFIIAYMNKGLYKNKRILKESTVDDILKIRNPASGTCLIWDSYLGDWFGHSGGMSGVSAHVAFQHDKKIGVAIFTNKRNKLVYPGKRIHALIRRIANNYINQ